MSSSIARTFSFDATSPRPICIEVEVHRGLSGFAIAGLREEAVGETRERLCAALANSGFEFSRRRVLVKVTPRSKAGTDSRFDLPIATTLLVASDQLRWDALPRLAIVGGLALDGTTRPVSALSLIARAALDFGADRLLIPAEQMEEGLAAIVPGMDVVPVESVAQLPDLAAEWPSSITEINHCVVTGTLRKAPEVGKGPKGNRVTLLRLDYLVHDPREPMRPWAKGGCDVEVPDELARRSDIAELKAGVSVLAAGQLSEREVVENGIAIRHGVIVASLVKAGPLSQSWGGG